MGDARRDSGTAVSTLAGSAALHNHHCAGHPDTPAPGAHRAAPA